jgi:hypothetical protein
VKELRNAKQCRSAFREILQGYSYVEERDIYIKHFTEVDLGNLEILYKRCEKELRKLGIDGIKDKLAFLNKEGYWTEDDENTFMMAKWAFNDAVKFTDTLQSDEQKEKFQKTIDEKKEEFEEISQKRNEIVNPTIESFCDRSINEHYVRIALYKDKELEKPYLTEEEFKDISYIELGELVEKYNEIIDWFTDQNLRRIAVNGFFLNSFIMSDNDPTKFYGKSVLEMTTYQMNLYAKGKFYKSILEEGKEPPDLFYEQVETNGLDPIVNWYDQSYAQIKNERAQQQMKAKRGR